MPLDGILDYEDVLAITNQYLYGQATTPNLVSSGIIRSSALIPPIPIDVNNFMTVGAGRFALPPQFEMINRFFSAGHGLAPRYPDNDPNTFDFYTKEELAIIFGMPRDPGWGWSMQQYNYQDTHDDYAARVYIFNSMSFKIADSARFIVSQSGERYIQSFGIEPNIIKNSPENFDFETDDLLTRLPNLYLKERVDPFDIGRKVDFEFIGQRTLSNRYDIDAYHYDIEIMETMGGWQGLDPNKLGQDINSFASQLWNDGVTQFRDSVNASGRPIIYGTVSDNSLSPDTIDSIYSRIISSTFSFPTIKDYRDNGLVLIGGRGNDVGNGGIYNDLYLLGSASLTNDRAVDPDGFDTYQFFISDGELRIADRGGQGKIIWNNTVNLVDSQSPQPIEPTSDPNVYSLTTSAGQIFTFQIEFSPIEDSTQNLVISLQGGNSTDRIVIENFQPGHFGIELVEATPEVVPPSEQICQEGEENCVYMTEPDGVYFADSSTPISFVIPGEIEGIQTIVNWRNRGAIYINGKKLEGEARLTGCSVFNREPETNNQIPYPVYLVKAGNENYYMYLHHYDAGFATFSIIPEDYFLRSLMEDDEPFRGISIEVQTSNLVDFEYGDGNDNTVTERIILGISGITAEPKEGLDIDELFWQQQREICVQSTLYSQPSLAETRHTFAFSFLLSADIGGGLITGLFLYQIGRTIGSWTQHRHQK